MVSDDRQVYSDEKEHLRKKLLLSVLVPFTLVFLMWITFLTGLLFEADFTFLGIEPLKFSGLPGIIFSPFLHGNLNHLISNSLPVLILGTGIFYFYSEVAFKVTALIYFLTGIFVWLTGRDSVHIGASGIVYGFAAFLFFSGIIRKYFRLIALSLLVVFLYGSMVWGMVPDLFENVSWESHMMGFVSGIFTAIIFRKQGPVQPVYEWMDEDDELPEDGEEPPEPGKNENK